MCVSLRAYLTFKIKDRGKIQQQQQQEPRIAIYRLLYSSGYRSTVCTRMLQSARARALASVRLFPLTLVCSLCIGRWNFAGDNETRLERDATCGLTSRRQNHKEIRATIVLDRNNVLTRTTCVRPARATSSLISPQSTWKRVAGAPHADETRRRSRVADDRQPNSSPANKRGLCVCSASQQSVTFAAKMR